MSEKEHVSATVDPEVKAFLDRDGVNTSATINKLVKKQMGVGDDDNALIELRIQQIESQIRRTKGDLESLQTELKALKKRRDENESEQQEKLHDAFEKLSGIRERDLTVDNPGVQHQADRVGLEPEELLKRYEERDGE